MKSDRRILDTSLVNMYHLKYTNGQRFSTCRQLFLNAIFSKQTHINILDSHVWGMITAAIILRCLFSLKR